MSDHEVIDRGRVEKAAKAVDLRQEAAKAAVAAVAQLPVEEKDVVLLKVIQGMTMTQICSITGMGLAAVNDRLTRGLRTLAARLKAGGAL